jgi:transcriptional regulator with XRE-family HTH domain
MHRTEIYDRLIGEAICYIRKIRRIKQTVIARSLGISQSSYSRIESGKVPITSAELKEIAGVLKSTTFQIHFLASSGDIKNSYKKTEELFSDIHKLLRK